MTKTRILAAAATVLGALALVSVSNTEASPNRKKAATKRTAISQPVAVNMACEGRIATITSTAFSSPSRDETSISFLMSVNRASGVVMIMRATGSRMIRAGRYAAFPNSSGMEVSMNWTDYNNQGQTLTLTFSGDGGFSGETQSSQPNNIGTEMARAFLGPDYAPMMDITTRHRIEGTCWQQ